MASLNKQTSYGGQNSALSFLVTRVICVSAKIQSSYGYADGIALKLRNYSTLV
jgi:hypothetical protein